MTEPCRELHRFARIDEVNSDLKKEMHSMREDMGELKDAVNEIKIDFRGFTSTVTNVISRMDERDARVVEIQMQHRDTFQRFGARIDTLERQLTAVEIKNAGNDWLSRLVWGALAGLGTAGVGLAMWLVQRSSNA